MLYFILIVIAILVYLIYRKQKPVVISKEQAWENLRAEVDLREERVAHKIESSHLKEYLDSDRDLLECGKKNFIRLSERFKHDETKLAQITRDWLDYLEILSDSIYHTEMLDVCTSEESEFHYNGRDELYIKLQEIMKRFKELLGKEYWDFDEMQKLKVKASNEAFLKKEKNTKV